MSKKTANMAKDEVAKFAAWRPSTDFDELMCAAMATRAAKEGIISVANMPRSAVMNETLENWIAAFSWRQQLIVEKARKLKPTTEREAELKAEILLSYEIDCGLDGDTRTLAAIVEGLAVDKMRTAVKIAA